jgi:hypothetical protein
MIVTRHKHSLRARAEYGHLVAMCGKNISPRALADCPEDVTCSICLKKISTPAAANK